MQRDADPLQPLWHDTAPDLAADVLAPAAGLADARPDVLVVGAGILGLSTALHLAERGVRAVVLERDTPGAGTSGRSNGQVIAGLQKSPDALVAAYGAECGERVVALAGAAPDRVFDIIERHGIACDASRDGWIQATRSARQMRHLESVADSWARRGAPVEMTDRAATARLLGTSVYAGGWLDRRNGTVQPLAYARGLATAAARSGVAIHAGAAVERMERVGDAWVAHTTRGAVRAKAVVLAANVFTGQLRGPAHFLGHAFLGVHSVEIATTPLDAARRAQVLPEGHACGDTSHLRLRYFRLDPDGRFVIGGPGWLTPPRTRGAISFRILEASARRMFPALRGVAFGHHWAARDTVTPDLLPHFYEPAPGLLTILGFNGRGIAIGTALGEVLARRACGEPADTLPFPTTSATHVPLALPAAARFYLRQLFGRFRH